MLSLRRLSRLRPLGLLAAGITLSVAAPAGATDPVLRHQQDLHGDVAVFGSTLGFDCGAKVSAPAGSIASCTGLTNIDDTAPDLFWRDNKADTSVTATQARTSATLVMPSGAVVTYARLYWAALKSLDVPDTDAAIDFLGGPQQTIVADTTWVVPYGLSAHPSWYYYQASGDATDFVAAWGAGDFRVSDVEAVDLVGTTGDIDRAFSAWTLVVFYEDPSTELRNLALFDSFTPIDPGVPGEESAHVTLSGFLVPSGFSARMSAFAYEGDAIYNGDHFTLNGAQLTDALNPADNSFNSSRSHDGAPVSGSQDVPMLSGQPGSMAGYDLDMVNVTSLLSPGDTSCVVGADSALDIFFLGGFVTSVASLSPDFHGMTKAVKDINGGAVVPGDTLEYTITAVNGGNDGAVNVVISDVLAPGLSLVAGSIEIVQGGAVGKKTNASGDDEGEYDAATRTITWYVGSVDVDQTVVVRFRATVTAQSGSIGNQAILSAEGESGAASKTYPSDSDAQTLGEQETTVTVSECDANADCPADKPRCDPTTHTCVGCKSDADCSDPANPACQPSGTCGQCSATNASLCTGGTPVCDTMNGVCVLCTLGPSGDAQECVDDPDGPLCVAGAGNTVHCGCNADSDCGGVTSGRVCDSVPSVCVEGCRGQGGNGCPDGMKCTSTDTTIGTCVVDPGEGGGGSTGGGAAADPGAKGGCGCEVPASGDEQGTLALVGMLGLAALGRRRR